MSRADEILAEFNAAPYYRLLGMVASIPETGRSRVSLAFREDLASLYGGMHGGVLLAMADSAANVALISTFDDDELTGTVQLAMSFLAPAGRRDLIAEGTLTKRGNRIAFADCIVRAGDEVVARAQGICYVSRRKS